LNGNRSSPCNFGDDPVLDADAVARQTRLPLLSRIGARGNTMVRKESFEVQPRRTAGDGVRSCACACANRDAMEIRSKGRSRDLYLNRLPVQSPSQRLLPHMPQARTHSTMCAAATEECALAWLVATSRSSLSGRWPPRGPSNAQLQHPRKERHAFGWTDVRGCSRGRGEKTVLIEKSPASRPVPEK
jgi:hypothetical protein